MSTKHRKTVRTARPCDWCGEPLEVGQAYDELTGHDYNTGHVWRASVHPECAHAERGFWDHRASDYADCWPEEGRVRGGHPYDGARWDADGRMTVEVRDAD